MFFFSVISEICTLFLIGAQKNSTVSDAIRETPATMIEAIICFFSIWSVVGLWGYHTYLICRSVTTNEDVSIRSFIRHKSKFLFYY
jgi:palmitoyltransferase ZDHHC9/14/18